MRFSTARKAASAGNRTRVTTMATLYSTTRPLMLCANEYRTLSGNNDNVAMAKTTTTPRGFEPLRAEPYGFLVHLLNHSDTVSIIIYNI